MFSEAVAPEKQNLPYYVMMEFIDASARKVKADDTHREQFVQDYIAASGYANEALKAATKESAKKNYQVAKENIDAHFINSGVATCDNLQAIYAPKVEENKTNLEYLKQVMKVMKMLGCTEAEAYFAASELAHAIEPTAETAIGCGYMYYKKGDFDKCISYFDNAIELEQDPIQKADYCYSAAAVLFANKQLSKAKQYARKSIELNGSNGKPYILIAQMYASSPKWSDEASLNKCTFFAVIDKLQKAKSVDESVTEQANELIRTYSGYTPKDEDLFFIGLKKGDAVTIGGWIGETTTIR
jgi:tetratricopeptide (TPR) repeat protein